ncbi:MAG: hypothetical protein HYY13_10355, partial [Nitrospirae bacterium]|nr:hypothetical protein [Nitrospirota bacterium]
GTDVYETLAGFPYQGPSTDIGNVSRGASVNWNSEQDEVYFGADDGKLHCVCTTTSVQGGNSCVIAVADRCDGTPGVGQACTGFPVTLQAGVALREPLIKDGTIYIASATGKIYAVEPLCDEGGADGTASGTVKSSNGFTFTLDTTGLDSSVSALDTGGPVQIMVGTNTGRVFYLPTAP